jgi:hypothetical protein
MGERRFLYRIVWGNLRERNHLEFPEVHARTILKWIFKKMTQDMDGWRAVVNAVTNLRFP